jgi:hypothetical protein
MSSHGVSSLYIFTHAGCHGHLCILQSSPLNQIPIRAIWIVPRMLLISYYVGFETTCRRTISNCVAYTLTAAGFGHTQDHGPL